MVYIPITEDEARMIVLTRTLEAEDGHLKPMRDFVRELHRDGVTRRLYSVRTVQNILNGVTYPNLTDAEGNRIVWERVPRRGRGAAARLREKLEDSVVFLKRRLFALEAELGTLRADLARLKASLPEVPASHRPESP